MFALTRVEAALLRASTFPLLFLLFSCDLFFLCFIPVIIALVLFYFITAVIITFRLHSLSILSFYYLFASVYSIRPHPATSYSVADFYFMGFFDHLQKGGSFSLQAQKPQIRKVVQSRPAPPSKPTSQGSRVPSQANGSKTRDSESRSASRNDAKQRASKSRQATPLRNRKRQTPELRLSSDDDASDTDTSFEVRKRARTDDSAEGDPERQVRSLKAFSEEGMKPFSMVHAADITSGRKAGNFKCVFGGDKPTEVLLQYPSASQQERYENETLRGCCATLLY